MKRAIVFAVAAATIAACAAQAHPAQQAPMSDEGVLCVRYAKAHCIDDPTPRRRAAMDDCGAAEIAHRLSTTFDACVTDNAPLEGAR